MLLAPHFLTGGGTRNKHRIKLFQKKTKKKKIISTKLRDVLCLVFKKKLKMEVIDAGSSG